jgi:sulfate permease, SulP family
VAGAGALARETGSIGKPQILLPHMFIRSPLLCVLLFAAPRTSYIPMAALAGILMIVSHNMGEWREIPRLLRLTKTDIRVWLVTLV